MPIDNTTIIGKAAITTGSLTSGLLNPEQSEKFIQQTFDATTLTGLVRHEMRKAKTGEIDKIGIGRRLLREKTENTDDGERAEVTTDAIKYACTAVRLPWEISEETFRENIEREGFEETVTNLMTKQLGVDLQDIYLNGDVDTDSGHKDYKFLKINDGWLKQIKNGGHVFDAATDGMSLGMYYQALAQMPNKYNNGNLRWLMSPRRAQSWEQFLLDKVINAGGAVPDSVYKSPVGIPAVPCAAMPDDTIVLTNPKNLVVVNSYAVQIRKTTEGKEAVMKDKRLYVIHLDFDPVIEELDATAIITNLA